MTGSFMGEGFAGRRGASGEGWPGTAIWETLDQLRGQFDRRFSPKESPRDVRTAVLILLAEKPLHGYQIINEIEERSDGTWRPTPGSVYPTLQLLVDEGLLTAEESDGHKTYTLTVEGRRVAEAAGEKSAPWEAHDKRDGGRQIGLPKAGIELARAAAQVQSSGSSAQVTEAVAVLDEARRKLYSILAQG